MSMSSHHSRTFDATVEAAIAIGSEDVLVYGENDDGNWQIVNVMPRQVPRVTIPAPYRPGCSVALLGGKLMFACETNASAIIFVQHWCNFKSGAHTRRE